MTRLERERIKSERRWVNMASEYGLRKDFARKIIRAGENQTIYAFVRLLQDVQHIVKQSGEG